MRSSFRRSLAFLAAAALTLPASGQASGLDDLGLRDDAQAALSSSIAYLRRVLRTFGQDEIVSHAIAVSAREATLELGSAGGRTHTMSLRGGRILIDGAEAGRYAPGGRLERSWRRLLADGADLETRALLVALRDWRLSGLDGSEADGKARLDDAVRGLGIAGQRAPGAAAADSVRVLIDGGPPGVVLRLRDLEALDDMNRQLEALHDVGPEVAEAVRSSELRLGSVRVAAGERVEGDLVVYRGDADVYGHVSGSVVALFGDVRYHRGALIERSAVSIGGRVLDEGGTVRGDIKTIAPAELRRAAEADAAPRRREVRESPAATAFDRLFRDVRNVLALFVAFAMLGFGTVFFGRRYLEVVADTARHSFGRSMVAGLLGQLLLLPTFAMLCVGLIFTLVGILLLPFAAVAYVVAAILAFVGGYLAVAHAVGETFARRRMANGAFVRAPNAYGYLFTGLIGLLGLWAAAALTGWMGPVVLVFKVAAAIVTWLAATVGFGAVLLSRAGLREAFAGRHFGEMSDEYLWATPPATPTASRMQQQ